MRLDAHPMIVAVALGLLGPAALESDDDEPAGRPGVGVPPAVVAPVDGSACADVPAACDEGEAR